MGFTGVIEGEIKGKMHQWVPGLAHGVWEKDRELRQVRKGKNWRKATIKVRGVEFKRSSLKSFLFFICSLYHFPRGSVTLLQTMWLKITEIFVKVLGARFKKSSG